MKSCGRPIIIPGPGVCEYFYTFMLTFVVLNVAAAKKNVEDFRPG